MTGKSCCAPDWTRCGASSATTNRRDRQAVGVRSVDLLGDDSIGAVFEATVDATEEAVCNALFVADTVIGRDGHVAPGLPLDRVLD